MSNPWEGFQTGVWNTTINVDDFINLNYKPYDGDESFLAGPTERTKECNMQKSPHKGLQPSD